MYMKKRGCYDDANVMEGQRRGQLVEWQVPPRKDQRRASLVPWVKPVQKNGGNRSTLSLANKPLNTYYCL
jgi:hypothetical protein